MSGFPSRFSVHVTAWVDGYYIGGAVARPWNHTVEISLQHYWTTDNPDYAWVPPAIEGRGALLDFLTQGGLSMAARLSFNRLFLPASSERDQMHGGLFQWSGARGSHMEQGG